MSHGAPVWTSRRLREARTACVLALSVVAGCTETVELGSGRLGGLVALDITPGDAVVEITDLGAGPISLQMRAVGRFVDGTRRDITELVEWSVDNPLPGSIVEPGLFQTTQGAAGHVMVYVRALAGNAVLEGTTTVHVIASLTLVDGIEPPPSGADALFAPEFPVEIGGVRAATVRYPSPGTLFPQDLARIVFQLAPGAATNAFRWRLDSESLHVTLLSGGHRWQPDGAVWSLIAATHPGADVRLVVEAADSNEPGTVYASPAAALSFARGGAGGVLYHWSAATNAVMRSTLSSESAPRLYPAEPSTTCVGCHTISRDGRQMALGYDGESLRSIELDGAMPIITAPMPMGWASYAPDGDRLVVANNGELVLRDALTGTTIGPNGGRLPLLVNASHPDWSPDGRYVAFTASPDPMTNMDVKTGSIARIEYLPSGTWGAAEVLVTGSPTNNNYFPKYSPDGRFLAFVHATTTSRGAPTAELRLVGAGGGAQIPLRIASHRVGSIDDMPGLANTMPTWAPSIDSNLAWIAFASARPYGEILPVTGLGQVWIAGLDLARAEAGFDPSFAAFWLPSQDVRVLNNNPIWAPHVQP